MKVYAHYFKSKETENEYRWRTLLQFGTSWEVIGSVVMKNPGSAVPLTPDKPIENEEILCHLRPFCSEHDWYMFTDDPTLGLIENLFRAYYETQFGNPELNGIIQVFNLINLCETDSKEAISKLKKEVLPFSKTIDKDITQLIAPVYLGFGTWRYKAPFRKDGEKFFHVVYNDMDGKYLHADYNANRFTHPKSLMGTDSDNYKNKELFHAFCQNTENPSY